MNFGKDHTNKGTLCTPYLAKRPLNVRPTKNNAAGLQPFIHFIWRTRGNPLHAWRDNRYPIQLATSSPLPHHYPSFT